MNREKYKIDFDFNKEFFIQKIDTKTAKEYIIKNHYAHGCHNGPSPCYGLFRYTGDGLFGQDVKLIGVCMFATPCSEAVRASLFGEEYKDNVTELHRLHILDETPNNTESWFVSRCLKLLIEDKPRIWGVISFSDSTEGHEGTIYKATNAFRCGKTGSATFFMDKDGRLHHPRQSGVNVTDEMAKERGWTPVKRDSKNRYIYILGKDKRERKQHLKLFKENFKGKVENW